MRWARKQTPGWDDADVRAILLFKIIRTEAMARARAKAHAPSAALPVLRVPGPWMGGVVVPLVPRTPGRVPGVLPATGSGSRAVEPSGAITDARRVTKTRHGRTLAAFLADGGLGG